MNVSDTIIYIRDSEGAYTSVVWDSLNWVVYNNDPINVELMLYSEDGAPEEFAECDGTKTLIGGISIPPLRRKRFALAYQSDGKDGGDPTIYIAYGLSTGKPSVGGACWTVTSNLADIAGDSYLIGMIGVFEKMKGYSEVKDILYSKEPRLPFPDEVAKLVPELKKVIFPDE